MIANVFKDNDYYVVILNKYNTKQLKLCIFILRQKSHRQNKQKLVNLVIGPKH